MCKPEQGYYGDQSDRSTELPVPRIEVYQRLAYNGGFAVTRKLLWHTRLIGVNGQPRTVDQMQWWSGSEDRQYADGAALDWHEFSGWPIVDLGRAENLDQPARN